MASQPLQNEAEHHNSTAQYPQEQSNTAKGSTMVSGSYLWTPPENTVDSFSQEDDSKATQATQNWEAMKNTLPPIQAHTPPASPQENTLPSLASATGYPAHDAPLYPEQSQPERPHSQTPLFENEIEQSPPTTLTNRISHSPEPISAPRPAQADIFPAILGVTTAADARRYYLDRLSEVRQRHIPSPWRYASSDKDLLSHRQLRQLEQHDKVSRQSTIAKQRSQPKPAKKPKVLAAASPEKVTPLKRRTPKARNIDDFVNSAFPSPQTSTKHKRAPPSKKVENDNVRWTDLPDYAPPTSTLDSNPKQLKATWHGHALSLADDPDRAHLHPEEVAVASTLRLQGAVYLTNKRKIFQARVQAIRDGKNFTKTAAQGACSIDVNKASQLWEAFERVGWFKDSWFEQFV